MRPRFKLKISRYEDREPVAKATGENIRDFDPIIKGLKDKFDSRRRRRK